MRIWHIAEAYPPDYCGGAAIYLRDICRLLAERGHEVRVLCTTGGRGADYSITTDFDGAVRLDRMSLSYFRERDPGGWHLGIRGWRSHRSRVIAVVEGMLADWTPDVVQFHTPYSLYEECFDTLKQHRLPIVGLLHCAWLICPRLRLMRSPTNAPCSGPAPLKCLECLYSHWDGSDGKALVKLPWRLMKLGGFPAYRLMRRAAARRSVDGLIGYSRYMTEIHRRCVDAPVVHIPLGVDLSDIAADRPERPRRPLRFGFLGGFQEHKGIWDVLDAAACLNGRGLPFELHIWGPRQNTGPIAERGLDRCVTLHGMFAPEEKWRVLHEVDVLIMATRDEEPYGRVVQEAAAAGVPTLAPAAGGISEQIRHGVDGLLFEFRNRNALEQEMARLIENPWQVSKLIENLWTVVDTRDAVADVEAFFRRVIENRATNRCGQALESVIP